MNINDDIFVLDEEAISAIMNNKPEPAKDDGLTEQVVRSVKEPKLIGEEEIVINKTPFVIGKDSSCDFSIKGDTYISRKHCRIVKQEDSYYIEDLDSTNGTFVDGEEIKGKVKLEEGQEIKLADRSYRWEE